MSSDLTPIGIPKLDEALGGGIQRGSVILLEFDTGTRSDAFISTFLTTGLKQGELAYLLCTEHPLRFAYQQIQSKGIDVEAVLDEKQLIGIDAFTDAFGWGEFKPESEYTVRDLTNSRQVHNVIRNVVLALQPKDNLRGVIDSLTSIIHGARNPEDVINYIHHQMSAQKNHGNTLLYTIHSGAHSEEILGRLEHIVDCVIALYKIYNETGWKIALQIEKMRGVDIKPLLYEYQVLNGQITLLPFAEEEEEAEEEEAEEYEEEEAVEAEEAEEIEEEEAITMESTPEPLPEPVFEPLPETLPPPAPEYTPEPAFTPTQPLSEPEEPEEESELPKELEPSVPTKKPDKDSDDEESQGRSTFFF